MHLSFLVYSLSKTFYILYFIQQKTQKMKREIFLWKKLEKGKCKQKGLDLFWMYNLLSLFFNQRRFFSLSISIPKQNTDIWKSNDLKLTPIFHLKFSHHITTKEFSTSEKQKQKQKPKTSVAFEWVLINNHNMLQTQNLNLNAATATTTTTATTTRFRTMKIRFNNNNHNSSTTTPAWCHIIYRNNKD